MTARPLKDIDQRRLDDFRSFYGVVIALRDRFCIAQGDASTPRSPDLAGVLQEHLRSKLEALGYMPVASGDDEPAVGPAYVMVAMADEMILAAPGDWPGRVDWVRRPLERAIYGTRLAGDRVFEAARKLIDNLGDETGTAIVILTCILLGYQGRYRDEEDGPAEIARVRDELYKLVHGQPWTAAPTEIRVAPESPPLSGKSVFRLPALWPWFAAIAAIVLAYMPATHLFWWWQVRHVSQMADTIVGHDSGRRGP